MSLSAATARWLLIFDKRGILMGVAFLWAIRAEYGMLLLVWALQRYSTSTSMRGAASIRIFAKFDQAYEINESNFYFYIFAMMANQNKCFKRKVWAYLDRMGHCVHSMLFCHYVGD